MDNFKDILKKCFGKEKDERLHAIAMLIIYGVFFIFVIAFVRLGGSSVDNSNVEETINYSYTCRITNNDDVEIYLGKRVGNKEKFTLIKDGKTLEYAITNNKVLRLVDGIYVSTNLNTYYKYCNQDKILAITSKIKPTINNNTYKYIISNNDIELVMKDEILEDNNLDNTILIEKKGNTIKKISLDYDNYLTSLEGIDSSFNVVLEYSDIGTTEDFNID